MLCLLVGCYTPPQPACGFLCSTAGRCPSDYHCASDGICHLDGTPADTSCGRDAGTDARIPDSPPQLDADITPPTVIDKVPIAGATNVAVSASARAQFDEPVANTPQGMSLTYGPGAGTAVDGIVDYDPTQRTATFLPTSQLIGNTLHTVSLTSVIVDNSVNHLVPVTWTFTTAPDAVAPAVVMTTPLNNATNVPVATPITVVFTEPVANVNATTFAVTVASTPVAGTFTTPGPRTFVFTPAANLAAASLVTVSLSTGITDNSGNGLTATTFSFTTQ